jgi:hypothetical protein
MIQPAARSDYGIRDLATNEFYQVQACDGLYVCNKPGLSGPSG